MIYNGSTIYNEGAGGGGGGGGDTVNAVAIAPLYDDTSTYETVGTAVMYNGKRYVNNTAILTAEAWTAAHWTETSVEDTIGNVETLLAAL